MKLEVDLPALAKAIRPHLLEHPLHSVLLVGSAARGVAGPGSDIDLMAFYRGKEPLRASSRHAIDFCGVDVTLEHHSYPTFLRSVMDFRFNIASLRMLLKVRDSLVVLQESDLSSLSEIASMACLDECVLLEALHACVEDLSASRALPVAYRRQQLLRWTEFLASIELLSRPGGPAYSKPKWLMATLERAGSKAIDVLRSIERTGAFDAASAGAGLQVIKGVFDYRTLPLEDHRLFFKVSISDFETTLLRAPDQAGPPARFVAASFFRFFIGGDPLAPLRSGTEYRPAEFGSIYSATGIPAFNEPHVLELVRTWILELLAVVDAAIRQRTQADIGSITFVPYFLMAYDQCDLLSSVYKVMEILPFANKETGRRRLDAVHSWCRGVD